MTSWAAASRPLQDAQRTVADVRVCPTQPVPDAATQVEPESVCVLLQGTRVFIAVRDADLGEADALQAAFAVARELAGQSNALHRLVLNGRVLYAHRCAASPHESLQQHLLFAC